MWHDQILFRSSLLRSAAANETLKDSGPISAGLPDEPSFVGVSSKLRHSRAAGSTGEASGTPSCVMDESCASYEPTYMYGDGRYECPLGLFYCAVDGVFNEHQQ